MILRFGFIKSRQEESCQDMTNLTASLGVIQAVNWKLGPDNIFIRSDATWFNYKG